MSIINYASREIQFKIVYYGPALCGKTTNLGYIHQRINPANRGDLVSLATAADRTLFFDFLPLNAVVIKGFVTKFQLYTVPGQVIYNATRQLVLRSVDGVVFVADSQWEKMEENVESFQKSRGKSGQAKHLDRRDSLRPAIQQARPAEHRAGQLSRVRAEQSKEARAKLRSHLEHRAERFRLAQRRLADSAAQIQQTKRRAQDRAAARGHPGRTAASRRKHERHRMNAIPVLTIENVATLDGVLADFLKKAEAELTVVIDRGGNVISQFGDMAVMDVTIIAALAAGSFAATKELARRIGEVEFNALYHQGNGSHIFMNSVDDDTIMITVFGRRTTVGLVRFYSASAAQKVAALLKSLAAQRTTDFRLTRRDITAPPVFADNSCG